MGCMPGFCYVEDNDRATKGKVLQRWLPLNNYLVIIHPAAGSDGEDIYASR